MKKIIINGARPLCGSVRVGGSKNAALPVLFATIATRGVSVISNFPKIGDTEVALRLLSDFGAEIFLEKSTLYVDTTHLSYKKPDDALVKKIRASTYLIGATLSRFGIAELSDYGGCNFSLRPIDLHIYAATALGAVEREGTLYAKRLLGGEIKLRAPSVGATVNSLIMAANAEGQTKIFGFAKEPHVLLLVDYLRSSGADISVSEGVITVNGRELFGGKARLIGDMIEAGTYLSAGLITGGEVEVLGASLEDLAPFTGLLSSMGAALRAEKDSITLRAEQKLSYREITAAPYPRFPTDLQPVIAPLFARNSGGLIRDTIFPERFGYLLSLERFGIEYERGYGFARISPSRMTPGECEAPDLRGGAACLLAALASSGESVIGCADIILRGYESPVEKLALLGADIKTDI